MAAPDSFTLEVVKVGLHVPPEVPRCIKGDIYKDLGVFKSIDQHAIEVSQTEYKSFRDLIWNLCFKKKFVELEKARAIFRWMTCRNLQTIKFSESNPSSPEQLLSAFKDGKATYARIFECLARHSGLACMTISGWAKGVDYRPGVPITSKPINHSWNGIYIDGNWQLVDCHWATRFLQSEKNIPENLVYEYDDFYFITEPEQLAYTHQPEDPAWQLLDPALTKVKFEDYPLIKSYFFTSGMYLLHDCIHGVIHSKKGIAVVSLGFTDQMAYTFKLGYGDDMQESVGGISLARCALQEANDNQVIYRLRLPKKGDFYLIVFANVSRDEPQSGESVFKAVCEYKIVCDEPVKGEAVFPACSDIGWGPDTFASQYGLTPENRSGILYAPNGHAEVVFKNNGDARVYARLVKDGMDKDELKKHISVKKEKSTDCDSALIPLLCVHG